MPKYQDIAKNSQPTEILNLLQSKVKIKRPTLNKVNKVGEKA